MSRVKGDYTNLDDSDVQLTDQKPRRPLENTLEATVLENDTLASIALRFNCTVADLKRLNKIDKDNEIYARKTLRIPLTPYSALLDTTLPGVHKSGNSSPKASTSREILDYLSDEKLEEKLIVASISNTTYKDQISTVNLTKLISPTDYLDDQNVATNTFDPLIDTNPNLEPNVILARPKIDFSFNGSDCDINWICLFICILALCFAIPVIYVLYAGEKKIHPEWFITETPNKHVIHSDT